MKLIAVTFGRKFVRACVCMVGWGGGGVTKTGAMKPYTFIHIF